MQGPEEGDLRDRTSASLQLHHCAAVLGPGYSVLTVGFSLTPVSLGCCICGPYVCVHLQALISVSSVPYSHTAKATCLPSIWNHPSLSGHKKV